MLHFWYLNAQPKLVLININRNNLFYIFALWTFLSWCILKCIPPAGFHSSATGHSMKNWFCLFDLEMCDSFQKKVFGYSLDKKWILWIGFFTLLYIPASTSSQCSITILKLLNIFGRSIECIGNFALKPKTTQKTKNLLRYSINETTISELMLYLV